MLTSTAVSAKTFRVALRGYAEEEVDSFLDQVVKALWEWEAGRQGKLRPIDIEEKTFRVALRGYAEEEVDQFLDEVTVALRQHEPDEKSVPDRPSLLGAKDVEDKTFRVALNSYAQKAVDGFLDQVVETLRAYEEHGQVPDLGPILETKTFPTQWRGYAQDEVDQFLEEIVHTLRVYQRPEIERLAPPVPVPAEVAPVEPPEVLEPPAPQPDLIIPAPAVSTEPTSTVTRLLVTRTAEARGRPYTILLDDQPIGKVSPGATQQFEIPTGMHWVTVKTRKEQSNTQVIDPHEGDQITLRCGPAAGDQIDDLGRKLEGIILEMTAE